MNISFAMSSDHSSPRLLAATIVLLTLTTACRHEPAYPTLLVEADSAFVLGDYRCADSLLAAFDQQTVKTERRQFCSNSYANKTSDKVFS